MELLLDRGYQTVELSELNGKLQWGNNPLYECETHSKFEPHHDQSQYIESNSNMASAK